MAKKKPAAPEMDDNQSQGFAPTEISKQEFGRRLYKLMRAKGWIAADLARAAFGTIEDTNGRTVARRRDSISSYLRGKVFPDQRSVELLCNALGVAQDELLPNTTISMIDREEPQLSIRQAVGQPDKVHLRINQLTTLDRAVRIASILNEKPAVAAS